MVKATLTFSKQKEASKPSFAMNSFKYLESHKEERDGCLQLFELLLRGFDSDWASFNELSHYLEALVAGGSSAAWLSLKVTAAWSYGIAYSLNLLLMANLLGSPLSSLHTLRWRALWRPCLSLPWGTHKSQPLALLTTLFFIKFLKVIPS